jgi:predicted metal-dependent hydrolase
MELDYKIVRSAKRKKLTITVERDRSIVVHAPVGASEALVRQLVEAKRQWLFNKLHHSQKYERVPHPPGKELVNGESALYLGREYRIEITETASGAIEFSRRFLVPAVHQAKRREVLRNWYVARANERILPRVREYARKLGVIFAAASIVDNRYRWGSCTVNDNVSFNWRLIKAPMFVVDYVIVHELVHFLENNHTPRFWSIVRATIPASERAKTWLKENGPLLEQEI